MGSDGNSNYNYNTEICVVGGYNIPIAESIRYYTQCRYDIIPDVCIVNNYGWYRKFEKTNKRKDLKVKNGYSNGRK